MTCPCFVSFSPGVEGVDPADLAARTIINLDSERWGEIIVGSAGMPLGGLRLQHQPCLTVRACSHWQSVHAAATRLRQLQWQWLPSLPLLCNRRECPPGLASIVAGDVFSAITLGAEAQPLPEGLVPVAIDVGGLLGGHSGEHRLQLLTKQGWEWKPSLKAKFAEPAAAVRAPKP